ncbi:MAG: hypothetical protein AAF624_02280 [Bacteroidota bacterium]
MIEISLLRFLKTGSYGPVRLGQTREQVRSHLGEPDDKGGVSRKYRRPTVWKYGDVQLFWPEREERLKAIVFYAFHAPSGEIPSGGKSIDLRPGLLRGGVAIYEALHVLDEAGIASREVDHWLDTHRVLETPPGVQLLFVDTSHWEGLYTISLRRE